MGEEDLSEEAKREGIRYLEETYADDIPNTAYPNLLFDYEKLGDQKGIKKTHAGWLYHYPRHEKPLAFVRSYDNPLLDDRVVNAMNGKCVLDGGVVASLDPYDPFDVELLLHSRKLEGLSAPDKHVGNCIVQLIHGAEQQVPNGDGRYILRGSERQRLYLFNSTLFETIPRLPGELTPNGSTIDIVHKSRSRIFRGLRRVLHLVSRNGH